MSATPELCTEPLNAIEASPPIREELRWRFVAVAIILLAESYAVAATGHPWLRVEQPMAAPLAFVAALLWFGRQSIRHQPPVAVPLDRRWLSLHAATACVLVALEIFLLRHNAQFTAATVIAVICWCASLFVVAGSLTCAFIPPRRLVLLAKSLGVTWLYAAAVTVAIMLARSGARLFWDDNSPLAQLLVRVTFAATRDVLHLLGYAVLSNPTTAELGTSRFYEQIAGTCSGTEGLSLILVLTLSWILYARRELRVVRALCLVPVALLLMAALNILRIVALIAIGDAGHPEVALTGFHAEAGWIAFLLLSIAFLTVVNRFDWLRREPVTQTTQTTNLTAAYLLPFLAILAAGTIAHAASSGFEWLYPLRLVACAAALYAYRDTYRDLRWSMSPTGFVLGLAVGMLWIALGHFIPHAVGTLPASLAALTPWQRTSWLACRVLAAVVTVPIAEELAFRGYLARRLMNDAFETVPLATLSLPAILISSVIFGAMHGSFWWLGTIAGGAFALAARQTGRFGDAVAAHAAANLVLAVWVLSRGAYWLW